MIFLCSRPNHHPKPYHLTIFLLFLAADGKSSPRKSHEYSETKNYDEDSEDGEYTACACQRWLFVTICMPLFFVISTLGFILVVLLMPCKYQSVFLSLVPRRSRLGQTLDREP